MICPVCGCQQRKTEVCVQCHAPLFAKKVKEYEPENEKRSPSLNDPSSPSNAQPTKKKVSAGSNALQPVLISSTQRIEGRRIARYLGLIHAEVMIQWNGTASSPADHQKSINTGVQEAMEGLRQEARQLKANAVVASSFDYQRIDASVLLLTAIGTAVLIKDRPPA